MKTCMVCPQIINVNWYCLMLLAYLENVPRELATCFREVLYNSYTFRAEPYGQSAPSPLPWPEQHKVGGGVILPCNYIIRLLPSTYDKKLSLLRHTVSKTKASRPMSH